MMSVRVLDPEVTTVSVSVCVFFLLRYFSFLPQWRITIRII